MKRAPNREDAGESDARATAAGGARIDQALRWALDSSMNASAASADWLASDIDDSRSSASELLTSSSVTVFQLRRAKCAYKMMRLVGETSADRRLGARLYAASIAAGLVGHGERISAQSDEALTRAFTGLLGDHAMPAELRSLAGRALCMLNDREKRGPDDE